MANKTVKAICKVCDGKGGWKKDVGFRWENDWNDCPYCEGFGFYEQTLAEENEASFLFAYNYYKKKITELMESIGKLISYHTQDHASTIEISFTPNDKGHFADFTKALLRYAHFNRKLGVSVVQIFFFEETDNKIHYYWKIVLNPTALNDVDGFIDFLKAWDKNSGGFSKAFGQGN